MATLQFASAGQCTTALPARLNSSSTPSAQDRRPMRSRPFISWRSTRGYRWSMASPRPSPKSIWWNGCCAVAARRTAAAAGISPCAAGIRHSGAAVRGRSGARVSAPSGLLSEVALPGHAAGGCLDRNRHRGTTLLRSNAGAADCACTHPRSGDRATPAALEQTRHLRHRDQPWIICTHSCDSRSFIPAQLTTHWLNATAVRVLHH